MKLLSKLFDFQKNNSAENFIKQFAKIDPKRLKYLKLEAYFSTLFKNNCLSIIQTYIEKRKSMKGKKSSNNILLTPEEISELVVIILDYQLKSPPKADAQVASTSVSFGEILRLWMENFLLFRLSNNLAKADAQNLITSGRLRPNWDTDGH